MEKTEKNDKLCCVVSENVQDIISDDTITENLSFLFKVFSEPIRIKILLVMLNDEICVKDLAVLLDMSQPRISNQLKFLKMADLVKTRKEKNNVFYSLNDEHIKDILSTGLEHINHIVDFEEV